MVAVSFDYLGGAEIVATITDATPTVSYTFYASPGVSTQVDEVAVTSTVVLTIPDMVPDGATFAGYVNPTLDPFPIGWIGVCVLEFGSSGGYPFTAIWDYDGDKTVTVTFTGENAVDYLLSAYDQFPAAESPTDFATGSGGSLMMTAVFAVAPVGGFSSVLFWNAGFAYLPLSARTFVGGEAGAGTQSSVRGSPYVPVPPPEVVYSRVYGIQITLSDDGVEQVASLVTSQDGFS